AVLLRSGRRVISNPALWLSYADALIVRADGFALRAVGQTPPCGKSNAPLGVALAHRTELLSALGGPSDSLNARAVKALAAGDQHCLAALPCAVQHIIAACQRGNVDIGHASRIGHVVVVVFA